MRSSHRHRVLSVVAAAVLGGLFVLEPVEAQNTGTLSGRVTQSGSGQPLGSVQVFLPELDLGVLTGANGVFRIDGVPPGSHSVTAERLGYRAVTEEVTVAAGETVVHFFQLTETALQLDEVIVTGTPGGTQRRAIGNSVATVDAADITARAQINNMQDLLAGQSPGVDFGRLSGNIGTGSEIRVRGFSSLSLGQQPLIYVDGVRMQNSSDLGPGLRGSGNRQTSALDDLNPSEIESIEIIKGPAAATLYGTEASAGVVQIITKRGAQSVPQYSLSVAHGANFMPDPSGKIGTQYGTDPGTGELLVGFDGYPNLYEYEKEVNGNEIFDYGHTASYTLSARGGTEGIRYFLSGAWQDNNGIVDYNWDRRANFRANVSVLLSEALTVDVATGYTMGETSYAQQLSEPGGIWEVTLWGQPALQDTNRRGFLRYTPEELETVEATRDYQRFTGSATLTHELGGWLTQRLIVGIDHAQEENQVLVPRHPLGTVSAFGGIGLGDVTLDRPRNQETTLDYSASVRHRLNDLIGLTTSVGAQYYRSEQNVVLSRGRVLASPSLRNIAGATTVDLTQEYVENKSVGVYVQQEVSFNDRVFFTAAIRADDNSAFGSDFDAAVYPKASATWVISEESFWADVPYVSSLRLRTALGQAGRQPDTFDAVTLFAPTVGRGGQPAMVPSTFGNPDVGPEVGTELELGFDYGLLEERISGEFTYYHQWTRDALASLPLSPSLGFSGSEVVNIGQLNNWGWEARLEAQLVDRPAWGLGVGLSGDHTMNEIIDLGPRPETDDLRAGFPFPVQTTAVILSAEFDETGAGRPVNVMCDSGTGLLGLEPGGSPVPCDDVADKRLLIGPRFSPWTWGINTDLRLGQNIQIFAMAQGEHGRTGNTTNTWCRFAGCFNNARVANTLDDPIYVESEVFRLSHPNDRTQVALYDASFWKLRQIGARYLLPERWTAGVGLNGASISVSGHNLWTIWVAQDSVHDTPIPDPEMQSVDGLGSDLGMMPGLASFSVRVDVTF